MKLGGITADTYVLMDGLARFRNKACMPYEDPDLSPTHTISHALSLSITDINSPKPPTNGAERDCLTQCLSKRECGEIQIDSLRYSACSVSKGCGSPHNCHLYNRGTCRPPKMKMNTGTTVVRIYGENEVTRIPTNAFELCDPMSETLRGYSSCQEYTTDFHCDCHMKLDDVCSRPRVDEVTTASYVKQAVEGEVVAPMTVGQEDGQRYVWQSSAAETEGQVTLLFKAAYPTRITFKVLVSGGSSGTSSPSILLDGQYDAKLAFNEEWLWQPYDPNAIVGVGIHSLTIRGGVNVKISAVKVAKGAASFQPRHGCGWGESFSSEGSEATCKNGSTRVGVTFEECNQACTNCTECTHIHYLASDNTENVTCRLISGGSVMKTVAFNPDPSTWQAYFNDRAKGCDGEMERYNESMAPSYAANGTLANLCPAACAANETSTCSSRSWLFYVVMFLLVVTILLVLLLPVIGIVMGVRDRPLGGHRIAPLPPPIPLIELEQIPLELYSKENAWQFDQTECTICLCEFEEGEKLRALPCGHRFHQPCIDEWLVKNPLCPLCKHDASKPYGAKTKGEDEAAADTEAPEEGLATEDIDGEAAAEVQTTEDIALSNVEPSEEEDDSAANVDSSALVPDIAEGSADVMVPVNDNESKEDTIAVNV